MAHSKRLWLTVLVASLGVVGVVAVAAGLRAYASGLLKPAETLSRIPESIAASGGVVINEIAWMGTEADASDEWIELFNATSISTTLEGWHLVDDDHLSITLTGEIPPHGYYLIERTDDDAVSDVPADWFGSFGVGGLSNAGEVLTLTDALGNLVDTANVDGGSWPAGTASSGTPRYATMERVDPLAGDETDNWCTNDGITRNGFDKDGQPLNGTPRAQNACHRPPALPTANLVVKKEGPDAVRHGGPITYRVILSNTGTLTASQTVLTDTLPFGASIVAANLPFSWHPSSETAVWHLGDVPPGSVITLTFRTLVTRPLPSRAPIVNVVTATTIGSESTPMDASACCTTTLLPPAVVRLPFVARDFTPPAYGVIIEALLYDGLQPDDQDEAVLILNGLHNAVDLTGWQLCKLGTPDWTCAGFPSLEVAPHQRVWLARSGPHFAASFGFDLPAEQVLGGWPRLANAGDEVALFDAAGRQRDVVVYKAGLTDLDGWSGAAVQPYRAGGFAEEGQILYRRPSEETGCPTADTHTAADWAQVAGEDSGAFPRVRYPGWDLERFFHPAVAATGTLTVGVAPDNAYDLVADAVRSARRTIDVEAYTLEHAGLVSELVAAAQRGVTVTVLLEGGPVGGVEEQELWACQQLHATGLATCAFMVQADQPRIYPRYRYLHSKVIIIDRRRLVLGSQNLAHTGLPADDKANGTGGSRGVVLVTDAPGVVARAVEVFEADCDREYHQDVDPWGPDNVLGYADPPPGFTPDLGSDWITTTVHFTVPLAGADATDLELLTAPESALRTSDALMGLLSRAGSGDEVCVEQLYEHRQWGSQGAPAPNPRLEAYVDAARRGARVRILLNGGSFDLDHLSLTQNIETAGYVNQIAQDEALDLSARLGDPTEYGIHNKMVLVDLGAGGKHIHVGSINGSETSSKVNREMALQLRSEEAFDYLYGVFEHDWSHQPPETHLLISEVMVDPSGDDTGQEWVELYNPTTANVDLSGWYVGDVGPDGEYGSGLYRFPQGATLVAEGLILLAQQAEDVPFDPDYEFLIDPNRDTASVPNLIPAGSWDGFGFALGNDGDEVLFLDPDQRIVDVVTYGEGDCPGVVPHPGPTAPNHSLERRPPRQDTDDCSLDFVDRYPATPGALPD